MTDVFNGDQTNGDAQAAPTDGQPAEDWVAKLAETRGETWKDPQVIAKGKLEADQHIENLEKQLAEMREDVAKNDYASKVLEALENKGQNTAGETQASNNDNGNVGSQDTTDVADVDIESLVEQTLTKREREAAVAQNVATVNSTLEKEFGTEAANVVKAKSEELGLSLDRMKEMAGESPKAFLALVGSAPPQQRTVDVSSSVNTSSGEFNNPGQKTFAYYQKMRRENPNQYYKPSVQNEMVKSREQMGDRFYS